MLKEHNVRLRSQVLDQHFVSPSPWFAARTYHG